MQLSYLSHAGPIALAAMLFNSTAGFRSLVGGQQAPACGNGKTHGGIKLERITKTESPLRLRAASARTFYPLTEDLRGITPDFARQEGAKHPA
jgi:hypothetical protein